MQPKHFNLMTRSERVRIAGKSGNGITRWPSPDASKLMTPTPKVKGPARPPRYERRRHVLGAKPTGNAGRRERGRDGRVLADYYLGDLKPQVKQIEAYVAGVNQVTMAQAVADGLDPTQVTLLDAEPLVRACIKRVNRHYGRGKRIWAR